MKLALKILVGVFALAAVLICYLLFSQDKLISDLSNYNKTDAARKARWKKPEPEQQPEQVSEASDLSLSDRLN